MDRTISARLDPLCPFDITSTYQHEARVVALRWNRGKACWFLEYPRDSGQLHSQANLQLLLKREVRDTTDVSCFPLLDVLLPLALRQITHQTDDAFYHQWVRNPLPPVMSLIAPERHYSTLPAQHFMATSRRRRRSSSPPSHPAVSRVLIVRRKRAPPPSLIPCCVCFNDEHPHQTLRTPCATQTMCFSCAVHWLQSHLAAPIPTCAFRCPCGQCQHDTTRSDVEACANLLVFHDTSLPNFVRLFDVALEKQRQRELVQAAGVDMSLIPLKKSIDCPGCHLPHLCVRDEKMGIPRALSCRECRAAFCTGCEQVTGESKHARCVRPWHQPAHLSLDLTYLDNLDNAAPTHFQSLLHQLSQHFEEYLGDAQCPNCHRKSTKGDTCTHTECSPTSLEPGCGTHFCFCCKGVIVSNRKQYVQRLTHPVLSRQLALVSRFFSTHQPFMHVTYSPLDFTLLTDVNETTVPSVWHNDGYENVFDPDEPRPAGRCPLFLSELRRFAWFIGGGTADARYLERWNELHLLRRLYRWVHRIHLQPEVARQLFLHPNSPFRDWDIIKKWLARGLPLVSAHHHYLGLAAYARQALPPASRPTSLIQDPAAWAERHLEWQRWVVADVLPSSEIAKLKLDTSSSSSSSFSSLAAPIVLD